MRKRQCKEKRVQSIEARNNTLMHGLIFYCNGRESHVMHHQLKASWKQDYWFDDKSSTLFSSSITWVAAILILFHFILLGFKPFSTVLLILIMLLVGGPYSSILGYYNGTNFGPPN